MRERSDLPAKVIDINALWRKLPWIGLFLLLRAVMRYVRGDRP